MLFTQAFAVGTVSAATTLRSGDGCPTSGAGKDANVDYHNGATWVDADCHEEAGLYDTIPGTKWVTRYPWANNRFTDYRIQFAVEPNQACTLRVLVHADNRAQVFLNSTDLGTQPGPLDEGNNFSNPPDAFTAAASAFVVGTNTLLFRVQQVTLKEGLDFEATVDCAAASPPLGRLCIIKFHDVNGNGTRQDGEGTLAGWVFAVSMGGQPFQVSGTQGTVTEVRLTTNQEQMVCTSVTPGRYTVTEIAQNGWVQTAPMPTGPQTVTVTADQATFVTFGNHQPTNLCIRKFDDANANGRLDPGEVMLNGWTFTIRDANGSVVNAVKTVRDGSYCLPVSPGTYTVTETQQNGWNVTTPGGLTQSVTVAAGQTATVTFGNERCCLTFVFLGGKIDNFSTSDGVTAEPVTPRAITSPPQYFDRLSANFDHRFWLPAGNCIQSAVLEVRLRAHRGTPANDRFSIQVPGGGTWTKAVSAVPPTGAWTPGKVKTVTLNLGALPSGGGSSNLITTLNIRRVLDLRIQDSTSVDYAKLTVVFCECHAR